MRPEYLLIYILGTALIGCDTSSANRPETETKNNPGKEICREFTNDSQGKCTTKLRFISSNYVVKKGHVYWMTKTERKEKPCGLGMPFFFHNLMSWRCFRSESNQIDHVEERRLRSVAPYSPQFKALEGSSPLLTTWQQEQMASYAKDEKSVFFKNIEIVGADPNNFEVVFPFGDDEMWKNISVSQSGKSLFSKWKPIGNIELNQFRAFTPVRCPENGLSCVKKFEDIKNDNLRHGIIGWIGDAVLVLHENGISRFPGMVSPDTFMFRSRYKTYLYAKKSFYELSGDHDKLIKMDVEFYERYNY
ncbi:DKNYY domain-containing protein [Pseudomonas sp. BF-R-19]|uniref:DKNYY domain-containing protein n=1 Tax=Pseudomonas sp. BF-R-19 TaxID=2832397 RepID=UPI001CC08ED6|nr:DKNYY domain-containing protein [Pseudomonas sp. BF-R-19]